VGWGGKGQVSLLMHGKWQDRFIMKSKDQILLEEAYSLVLEKKRKKKSKKRLKDRRLEKGILGGYWGSGNDSSDGGDGGGE